MTIPAEQPHVSAAPFEVAVVGCGIVGINVALALLHRNIPVTVYEQAAEVKDIGAGVGFPQTVKRMMREIHPGVPEATDRVAVLGPTPAWINGCTEEDLTLRSMDNLYDAALHGAGSEEENFNYCHRANLLAEFMKLLPKERIKLGKRLDKVNNDAGSGRVVMEFTDGTSVLTDAVIGCDGVRSRVRQAVLPPGDPAGQSHYAHESAYRCLVDMEKIRPAWGHVSEAPIMFTGKGAHIATYPVANHKFLNVAAFVRDNNDWPIADRHSVESSKEEFIGTFSSFGPTLRTLMEALPDKQSKWGLFDTVDHPLPSYAFGRVALAGDAAHASTPHHGFGACLGLEDALVLADLLVEASKNLQSPEFSGKKGLVLEQSFKVYDEVRRPRGQWTANSSRFQSQKVKQEVPEMKDWDVFLKDTKDRLDRLFYFDWKKALEDAVELFRARLSDEQS